MECTRTVRGEIDMTVYRDFDTGREYQLFQGEKCHAYKSNGQPVLLRVYSDIERKEVGRLGCRDTVEARGWIEKLRDVADDYQIGRVLTK